MEITLRGLTWDDARGRGPMPAVDAAFCAAQSDPVRIEWSVQPLAGFESASLEELATQYDLLILDHPHIGHGVAESCLAPVGELPDVYVGPTRQSYRWQGQQWAVPIDAACHVSAYRAAAPVAEFALLNEALLAAHQGLQVAVPLAGVHALMAVLTLAASHESPGCRPPLPKLHDEAALTAALETLREIVRLGPPAMLDWNPLDALAALARGECDYLPLVFGYAHFQNRGIRFATPPAVTAELPVRPILGGAGLAVSARSQQPRLAIQYARLAGSERLQRDHWACAGGQPAHCAAWDDLAQRDPFYRDTRTAIDAAFVRPRHAGWNQFQSSAGRQIQTWLAGQRCDPGRLARQLNDQYAQGLEACLTEELFS